MRADAGVGTQETTCTDVYIKKLHSISGELTV